MRTLRTVRVALAAGGVHYSQPKLKASKPSADVVSGMDIRDVDSCQSNTAHNVAHDPCEDSIFSMRYSRNWCQSDFVQQFHSNKVRQRSRLRSVVQPRF